MNLFVSPPYRKHGCYPPKRKKICAFHSDSFFVGRVIIFQGVFLPCSPGKIYLKHQKSRNHQTVWPSWRLSWACGIFTYKNPTKNRPDTEASQLRYWTAALQTCHASMLETFQVPINWRESCGFLTLKKKHLGIWEWLDFDLLRFDLLAGLGCAKFVDSFRVGLLLFWVVQKGVFFGGRVVGSIVVQNLFRDVLWYFKMDPFLWLFVEKFCASNFIPKKML